MANTTNFNWETPDDTDLVKDGAAAIRTLGSSIDTSFVDLKGGTTGQILSKASNTDLDYTWIANDQGDITEVSAGTGISVASGTGPVPVVTNTVATTFDAKGDLVVGTGADTFAKLTVGTNGYTLVADSAETTGLKWAAPSGATLIGCVIKRSTDLTLSNGSWAIVDFDQENYDTDGFHSTSVNTSRITIPAGKGGKYEIFSNCNFQANATGSRNFGLLKNGTEIFRSYGARSESGNAMGMSIYTVEILAAADYLEVRQYQDSGGNLSAYWSGNPGYYFGVNYLGA